MKPGVHNPFEAPVDQIEDPAQVPASIAFPAMIFGGVVIFEILLAPVTLAQSFRHDLFELPLTPVSSFAINVLILALISRLIASRLAGVWAMAPSATLPVVFRRREG